MWDRDLGVRRRDHPGIRPFEGNGMPWELSQGCCGCDLITGELVAGRGARRMCDVFHSAFR